MNINHLITPRYRIVKFSSVAYGIVDVDTRQDFMAINLPAIRGRRIPNN
jgi:hypothetical protein